MVRSIAFCLIACAGLFLITSVAPVQERLEVNFNKPYTLEELLDIKQEVAEANGISLVYRELSFDEDGKLVGIFFQVDCGDGFSGSASKNPLDYDHPIGFFRDYRPDATEAFGTGGL